MRYSICIIDDEIPAGIEGIRDSDLLNSSNLEFLLKQDSKPWTDEVLKNLIQKLLEETNGDGTPKWEVYGYTNPAFFINSINNNTSRFDIVIFDWDYPGAGSENDSESYLREILSNTFCLIFIFSKADKEDEISSMLAKSEFQEYKERLFYLNKQNNSDDQTALLIQQAEEKFANNFSFRFSGLLRKKAIQSVDKILSDMGRASLNDIKNHIAVGHGGKKDFIDFLAERFRTVIASKEIYELVEQIPETTTTPSPIDRTLAEKVWSYRLYFHRETGDELVRRGDIVKIGDSFHFILSADCDLGYFWKKNLGIINTITLHELDQSNSILKDLITLCVKPEKISSKISCLLGRIGDLSDGPFVFPFVPVNESIKNFIAIPKDLKSIRITLPSSWSAFSDKQKREDPMKYSYWTDAERICTVSEPFLTPVVQHVLSAVGGNGVPDYPDHMKEILKNILDDFSTSNAEENTENTLT